MDNQPELELVNFPLMCVDNFLGIVSELKTSKPSGIHDLNRGEHWLWLVVERAADMSRV